MAKKREKFLFLRVGGYGDVLFLTSVARVLHQRGYDIDVAVSDRTKCLLEHNQDIKNIFPSTRFGSIGKLQDGSPVNLITKDGLQFPDLALYEDYKVEGRPWRPYNVANYFRIIEDNSLHTKISKTQSSDFINTYDAHLGWAGIDPTTVPDSLKRPVYIVTKKEREWAKSIFQGLSSKPVIIQTQASSPARSISSLGVVAWLRDKGEHILEWHNTAQGGHWQLNGVQVPLMKDIDPMRLSGALIEQCKFAITSDTCVAHLAEALKIPHLTFYSTVPAWTRSKYYKYEVTVDAQVQFKNSICSCCVIASNCPRKEFEAFNRLSQKSKELLAIIPMDHQSRQHIKLPPHKFPEKAGNDPISYFDVTNEQALNQLVDTTLRTYQMFLGERAYCVASVDLVKELEENYDKLCKGDF